MKEVPKICGECKWMNQGEHSCQCFNPKQTDKDKIQYTYYPFTCELFEKGRRPQNREMNKLGYTLKFKEIKLATGDVSKYNYYTK